MSNFSIEKGLLNQNRFGLRDVGGEFFRAFLLVQKKRDIRFRDFALSRNFFIYTVNISKKSSPGIHIIAA